ncbi:uncharacterized protein LDX57_008563 [Aspergillus melleus]|uniref:uncharacterized protein n=1 Tax=Aspergillus melleus TaxID=138277 RepID=UPI001E8E3421|nr:uncharacterized protein LDX57_008563 [Aspergillus melleus]KAH8430899.1 hypothetical protein LDX57_008563 [Aspergillus melleus]
MPAALHRSLAGHGLDEVLDLFEHVNTTHVPSILSSLSVLAGTNLAASHRDGIVNFRLCDYHPDTAARDCANGCGAHTDYGTFSIIFQDGPQGLEVEDEVSGTWMPVLGDATIVLTGCCALILGGGRIRAARHRVRRAPGVRRLSAVLFVAPVTATKLQALPGIQPIRPFSREIMQFHKNVG